MRNPTREPESKFTMIGGIKAKHDAIIIREVSRIELFNAHVIFTFCYNYSTSSREPWCDDHLFSTYLKMPLRRCCANPWSRA